MKRPKQFKDILQKLAREPQVKEALTKARRQMRRKGKAENLTGALLLALAVATRFVSRKKRRAVDDLMDSIFLLLEISLLLKENIFDRPEVKKFFRLRSKKVSVFVEKNMAAILARTKKTSHELQRSV